MHKSKDEKRKFAKQLITERATRTDQQQIEKLDTKLGKGVGAARERKRLTQRIKSSKK